MSPDKLVRMANQIAAFFTNAEPKEAEQSIAVHINDFWEPRMRRQFLDAIDAGEAKGLDPAVLSAAKLIRDPRSSAA